MPLPATKQELADWVLRRLGAPVINVEIADVQLEDCIDEAVQFFYNYHYDGVTRSWRTIKVDSNLLNRNNRIHQDLTAEKFDSDKLNDYRIGDRVMFKVDNTRGNRIFIKTDSESINIFYDSDTNGAFVRDSDGNIRVFDSDLDISGSAKFYDSEDQGSHILDSDGSTFRAIDSDLDYYQVYDSDNNGSYILDSDGVTYRLIDSDLDYIDRYDSDNETGLYVQDSDGISFRLFDSDLDTDSDQRFKLIIVERATRYTQRDVIRGQRFSPTTVRPRRFGKRTVHDGFSKYFKEELKVLEDENITVTSTGQIGIKVPDSIVSVTKVAKVDSFTHAGMYNFEYQYFLNNFDMFYGNAVGTGLSNYYTQKLNVEHIDFLLNTAPAIRFNQYRSRLYLDVDWNRIKTGKSRGDFYLLCEVYEQADPELTGEVYKNTWLKRYATVLAKQQWGSNLKKYQNTELPGGVQLDGQGLWDEANAEKQELEEELKNSTLEMDSILWG